MEINLGEEARKLLDKWSRDVSLHAEKKAFYQGAIYGINTLIEGIGRESQSDSSESRTGES